MKVEERYSQPHEGITGLDRPGDPLLSSEAGSVLIHELVDKLYRASLSNTPAALDLFRRMTKPVAGDRVVVWDARNRDDDTLHKAVGYLLAVRREWWTTDEQWEQDKAEDGGLTEADRMIEPAAWYVQYGVNAVDVCRWVNCTVLAIP